MRIIVIKSTWNGDRVAGLAMNDGFSLDKDLARLEQACEGRDLRVECWRPDDMDIDETIEFIKEEYPHG